MKPKVIVVLAEGAPILDEFSLIHEVADPVYVSTADEYRVAQREAQAMFVCDLATTLIQDCGPGAVQWIQTNSIGVNAVATREVVESEVLITNTRGLFETPMAEFVLGGILFHLKGMRTSVENQRHEVWDQRPTGVLGGRRAVVVGAGGVGAQIVLLLRAVGVETEVVGRTRRADDGPLGLVRGIDELPGLLPETDDLVLAAPLTDATRGMIGADELAAMKRGVHVVNIGRGPLLDEGALVAALRSGHVGAATLDVFESEPLAPGHPFWNMENVLVSPHQSANFIGWRRDAVELFVRNLKRWQAGDEMENLVNASAFVLGRS